MLVPRISRLVEAVQLRKGSWHLCMPTPSSDNCEYEAIQSSWYGCAHRNHALIERVHFCRVYSKRQAVPGLKKRKTSASKLAINRLNGLYCAHVIHKSLPPKSASGLPPILESCYDNPTCFAVNHEVWFIAGQAEAKERANKKGVGQHLFHDESMTTFFRRLAWSPDGAPALHSTRNLLPSAIH